MHILLTIRYPRLQASCFSLRVGEVLQKMICPSDKKSEYMHLVVKQETSMRKYELTTFFEREYVSV
jgi:hypothetical protein